MNICTNNLNTKSAFASVKTSYLFKYIHLIHQKRNIFFSFISNAHLNRVIST